MPTSTRSERAPAVNAPCCLSIPTPDGSGQAVHPDVLHVPGGFLGYAWWMGCTPYPFAADRLENPIIRVSHDGMTWMPFPGAPDPLVEAPHNGSWHHADTDIVLHHGVLHVFYISTNREAAETTMSFVSTRDGTTWTLPEVIYRGAWGVSPAVVVDDEGRWTMWYVWRDALARAQTSIVYRCDGDSPARLGPPSACELEVPGHVVWHLDVIRSEGRCEALVAAFPRYTDPSRCRLFHATSDDGRHFKLSQRQPLLCPSWLGWDNRFIYRSTFTKDDSGHYRIWYSAASWGLRCGIGLVEGSLSALSAPASRRSRGSLKLREDAVGLLKYALYRWLPAPAYARLLSTRTQLRALLRSPR